MQKYKSNITTTTGAAVRGAPVSVIDESGSLATLFLDRQGLVPAPNPMSTDSQGIFYFYAVNGRYSLRTTIDGITITDDDVVLMNDPEEIATAGPIAEAVAAAQAAAQQAENAVADSGIPELVSAAQNAVIDANNAVEQAQGAASLADTAKSEAAAAKEASLTALTATEALASQAGQAKTDAQAAAAAAALSAESVDTTYLLNRANHTGTQAVSTIAGLEDQTSVELLAAIAMAKTFTAVPAEFQAWVILVTQPHLRQMVWSIAKNKYVRAPWHPVGKAGYFLREVGEGFLQVRGDVVLQSAHFPDLVEYLGVTGPTFVLDEARAEFVRNADSGRGKDAGRVVGSHQGDAGRNLTGSWYPANNKDGGALGSLGGVGGAFSHTGTAAPYRIPYDGSLPANSPFGFRLDASIQWPIANEFRGTNLAYIFAVSF